MGKGGFVLAELGGRLSRPPGRKGFGVGGPGVGGEGKNKVVQSGQEREKAFFWIWVTPGGGGISV